MIKPVRDRIVVRRFEGDRKTEGGLFIPDAHREKLFEGEVLAVGPGAYQKGVLCPTQVKPGDHVLWAKHRGVETNVDGEDVVIILEEDLLAVLS